MNRWTELQKRLMKLVVVNEGPSKSSSGDLKLYIEPQGGCFVEFGGYDVMGWSRQEEIGPFKDEEEAYQAAIAHIAEAETRDPKTLFEMFR